MKLNAPSLRKLTHEGGVASHLAPAEELARTVSACFLWEDGFYENGRAIADRIQTLVAKCDIKFVAQLAIECRTKKKLRHVPLLIVRAMLQHDMFKRAEWARQLVGKTLESVVERPDELAEFLAIYWKDDKAKDARNRSPIPKQVKLGLSAAFRKFSEYQLAKYNRDGSIKLRDVMRMVHPRPENAAQAELWKRLLDGKLQTPDTWEVALSGGADKKETFERLIAEGKLGYLAILRNLRNMVDAGVDRKLVEQAILNGAGNSKVLPFRFIAAATAAPAFEPFLDQAMAVSMAEMPRLAGETTLLVDVSGSMLDPLSGKSDLRRIDAACGLAILLRGLCERVNIFTFNTSASPVPARTGMALRDAILKNLGGGTLLGRAVEETEAATKGSARLIVITDEQASDCVPAPCCRGYIINVGTSERGVGYGPWMHINGFSESVVQYIAEFEGSGR